MKSNKLIITFMLILLLSAWNANAQTEIYNYHADVDGMVCAFCSYTVSKNIGSLESVDADSVDVNLDDGYVVFRSSKKIAEKTISDLFSKTGFTISNLTISETNKSRTYSRDDLSLDLTVDIFKSDLFNSIYQSIGEIAGRTPSVVIITAPQSLEETLLKPILMGRRQVIKARFINSDSDKVNIQLFEISEIN